MPRIHSTRSTTNSRLLTTSEQLGPHLSTNSPLRAFAAPVHMYWAHRAMRTLYGISSQTRGRLMIDWSPAYRPPSRRADKINQTGTSISERASSNSDECIQARSLSCETTCRSLDTCSKRLARLSCQRQTDSFQPRERKSQQ